MSGSGQMRESASPSAYREKNPYNPPPPPYKPKSILAEYKGLAILFAAISIGFAVYCLSTPRTPPRHAARITGAAQAPPPPARPPASAANGPPAPNSATAAQPIYIETIPDKDSR